MSKRRGVENVKLNKTHGGMSRFANTQDNDFVKVSSCLIAMAAAAKHEYN
jgi:hypothetical protein